MEYYKDEKITVSFNHTNQTLTIQFYGFLTSRDYLAALLQVLRLMKVHRVDHIIADTSEMKMICSDDQQWTIRYVLPKAYTAGCKSLAVIPSKDYFNRISADFIYDVIQSHSFPLKMFHSAHHAQEWIQTLS